MTPCILGDPLQIFWGDYGAQVELLMARTALDVSLRVSRIQMVSSSFVVNISISSFIMLGCVSRFSILKHLDIWKVNE